MYLVFQHFVSTTYQKTKTAPPMVGGAVFTSLLTYVLRLSSVPLGRTLSRPTWFKSTLRPSELCARSRNIRYMTTVQALAVRTVHISLRVDITSTPGTRLETNSRNHFVISPLLL